MNRKQRVRMLVQLLVMPFTRAPFQREDLLLDYVRAYQRMRNYREPQDLKKLTDEVKKSEHTLLSSLLDAAAPNRISEVKELLERFYPSGELADHLEENGDSGLEGCYLQMIFRLAVELITLRDGKVSIKTWETPETWSREEHEELFPDSSGLYKVELWGEISRVITPDILIAAYFVHCGIHDTAYLRNVPDNIFLSDTLFSQISNKGVAETHLHFSAGMSYQSLWEAVTDPRAQILGKKPSAGSYRDYQKKAQEKNLNLMIAGWLRLLMARFLTEADRQTSNRDILEYYTDLCKEDTVPFCTLLQYVLGAEEDQTILQEELEEHRNRFEGSLEKYFSVDVRMDEIDILLCGPYKQYKDFHTSPELILIFFALLHIHRNPQHSEFQRVLLCYLRIKNQYFSNKVQSTGLNGLTFFREYFHEATSNSLANLRSENKKLSLSYKTAFRNQLRCTALEKLEIKLTPPVPKRSSDGALVTSKVKLIEQLTEVFKAYLEVLKDTGRERAATLGVVYNLTRENLQWWPGSKCWNMETQYGPGDVVSEIRRRSGDFVCILQQLRREIPVLAEYVVGLDVASEEVYTEPWVYAPVYHQARNRYNTYPVHAQTGHPIPNIGLTYHVGEDYHHIISGLRHIDEVLCHFGYRAGDRLGHGMALQVDIEEWIHDNEVTALPILEHLENLLWLWSLCGEDSKNLSEYLPGLEKEIMGIASKLYSNIKGLNPYVLWLAYNQKFHELDADFCQQMKRMYLYQPEQEPILDEMRSMPTQRSFCARVRRGDDRSQCLMPGGDTVWDVEKLRLTYHCPAYGRHYQMPHFISNSKEKTRFYQAVQAHIRRKVEQLGVYVETNPTSNLMIGDIRGLSEYPIDELNDRLLRESPRSSVLVTVNSDDPLVFNTNIENELALIYHTLLYRGLDRERVLAWIDKVRQFGMDSSFIRRTKNLQQQKEELEKLVGALEEKKKEILERGRNG